MLGGGWNPGRFEASDCGFTMGTLAPGPATETQTEMLQLVMDYVFCMSQSVRILDLNLRHI